ncbi:MAG: sensor histidine kinase [Erythrobacter sp.]|uniref:sensor histidine kinase n=1 Tax=Erythrobacter sp. TaxID=1042 RepID=UPI003C77CC76
MPINIHRLAQFDISRSFLSPWAKLSAQIAFGVFCALAMIGLRTVINIWAPESGPFALVYPTALLATLYGHWRAGMAAFVVAFAWAWWIVLPANYAFSFTNPTDPARVLINAAACLIVIVFAEAFRNAAHSTMEEIREAADRRLVLLAELEHRTKNNFALVASLIEIQKRRLRNPDLDAPLSDAAMRVRTFADAYSNLALEQEEGAEVGMKTYLELLVDRIERAAFDSQVRIYREIDDITLPREVGVAIGLYLNEALANCAKYAFPEGGPGTVVVTFHAEGDKWRLAVEDDGIGAAMDAVSKDGGLGSSLMDAFAAQASGEHRRDAVSRGFRVELRALEPA